VAAFERDGLVVDISCGYALAILAAVVAHPIAMVVMIVGADRRATTR